MNLNFFFVMTMHSLVCREEGTGGGFFLLVGVVLHPIWMWRNWSWPG